MPERIGVEEIIDEQFTREDNKIDLRCI